MSAPKLTIDQQKASDAFFNFLMSDDAFFVISGSAGTGKTFLMSYLCNVVMDNYSDACKMLGITPCYNSVTFTATTHKAAEVLEQSLKVPVRTVHSFLHLKVSQNYSTGKTLLTKRRDWKPRTNEILFIDECSMINADLMNIILETMQNSKVVFVGDHAQMAPVNESISQIYTLVDASNFAVLEEPVRNAETPALVDLCDQLRETVETGVFHPIKPVPGVIEYLTDNEMQQELQQHFHQLDPSCRILCYTNDRVQQFNQHIRENVRKQTTDYHVGDVLVVASTIITEGGKSLHTEREVIIQQTAKKANPDTILLDKDHELDIYYQEAVVRELHGTENIHVVRIPNDMNVVNQALKHFAKKKAWGYYFTLKDKYVDLRDKAACTVYKAQGSTYDTVFVDIGNIGTSHDAEQVARMLFVAVSRARHKVYLYGRLPSRYIGAKAA